jgi:hypothetical protein
VQTDQKVLAWIDGQQNLAGASRRFRRFANFGLRQHAIQGQAARNANRLADCFQADLLVKCSTTPTDKPAANGFEQSSTVVAPTLSATLS